MTNEDQNQIREEPTPIAFSDFLESIPPSSALTAVADLLKNGPGVATQLTTPDVQLHCPSDTCNGTRFLRFDGNQRPFIRNKRNLLYLTPMRKL